MTPAPQHITPWTTTAQAREDKHERYFTLAEQYRVTAKQWADAEAAASLLEETKSCVLSELAAQADVASIAGSEREARRSPAFRDHIDAMVAARRQANVKKVHLKYIEMLFYSRQGADADRRAEMRLSS